MQHRQNRRCLQGCAVVAVQHGAHRLGMHPLGERRSPGQVSRMLGTVSVMHLKADDLAAVEVEDQVEVEPASLDLRRQERHVPAPDVAGTGGNMRARRARRPRWLGPSPAVHLAMCAQHTMEAGLAGDVDTLVGQCRDNPRRRRLGKARLVGYRHDLRPFGLAQSVRWDGALSVRPTVPLYRTVTGLPAPQRAGVDAGQGTGRGEPGSVRAGLFDFTHQDLAVFQAGHASSPPWKTAESFFDSTSKAAVSASALSLRCNSRSNSLTRRWSCRASTALAARGSPRPAIASRFQPSNSVGYSPCSRHQALRVASSIIAVTITACSRAAAVQRGLPAPDPLARASARQRSNVATLIPTSRETSSIAELSGGNSRATIRSLYACPYRATVCYPRPQRFRSYVGDNFSDTEGLPAGIDGHYGSELTGPQAAWRACDGEGPTGRCCGLHARQGHERAMVPGRQRWRGGGCHASQSLRHALGHR